LVLGRPCSIIGWRFLAIVAKIDNHGAQSRKDNNKGGALEMVRRIAKAAAIKNRRDEKEEQQAQKKVTK